MLRQEFELSDGEGCARSVTQLHDSFLEALLVQLEHAVMTVRIVSRPA